MVILYSLIEAHVHELQGNIGCSSREFLTLLEQGCIVASRSTWNTVRERRSSDHGCGRRRRVASLSALCFQDVIVVVDAGITTWLPCVYIEICTNIYIYIHIYIYISLALSLSS